MNCIFAQINSKSVNTSFLVISRLIWTKCLAILFMNGLLLRETGNPIDKEMVKG